MLSTTRKTSGRIAAERIPSDFANLCTSSRRTRCGAPSRRVDRRSLGLVTNALERTKHVGSLLGKALESLERRCAQDSRETNP